MKILLNSNIIWTIVRFRIELIKELIGEGHEIVCVADNDNFSDSSRNLLESLNVKFVPLKIDRKGINPLVDLLFLLELYRIYREEKPDVVITYTIKLNIYGSIVSRLLGIKSIPVVTGLGYTFTKPTILSRLIKLLYKGSLGRSKKICVLNDDDADTLVREGIVESNKVTVLPSEGINTGFYKPGPFAENNQKNPEFTFIYIGRLLHDKGVGLIVDAARRFKGQPVRFEFLGFVDEENPSCVTRKELDAWQEEGVITYLGSKDDIRGDLQRSDCLLFPSHYKEGVPRILLEAGAMEIPVITTDNVGCRDVVKHNYNGLVCKTRSSDDLYEKCKNMIDLPQSARDTLGKNSRSFIEQNFSSKIVNDIYLKLLFE